MILVSLSKAYGATGQSESSDAEVIFNELSIEYREWLSDTLQAIMDSQGLKYQWVSESTDSYLKQVVSIMR